MADSLVYDLAFIEKLALELCPFMENHEELEPMVCRRSCVNCRNAARQVAATVEAKIGETHGGN